MIEFEEEIERLVGEDRTVYLTTPAFQQRVPLPGEVKIGVRYHEGGTEDVYLTPDLLHRINRIVQRMEAKRTQPEKTGAPAAPMYDRYGAEIRAADWVTYDPDPEHRAESGIWADRVGRVFQVVELAPPANDRELTGSVALWEPGSARFWGSPIVVQPESLVLVADEKEGAAPVNLDDVSRAEHLDLCKARALEELEASGATSAIRSMLSDLQKHSETRGHPGTTLAGGLMLGNNEREVRNWIEGFR